MCGPRVQRVGWQIDNFFFYFWKTDFYSHFISLSRYFILRYLFSFYWEENQDLFILTNLLSRSEVLQNIYIVVESNIYEHTRIGSRFYKKHVEVESVWGDPFLSPRLLRVVTGSGLVRVFMTAWLRDQPLSPQSVLALQDTRAPGHNYSISYIARIYRLYDRWYM